jgi:hypothetical protein
MGVKYHLGIRQAEVFTVYLLILLPVGMKGKSGYNPKFNLTEYTQAFHSRVGHAAG